MRNRSASIWSLWITFDPAQGSLRHELRYLIIGVTAGPYLLQLFLSSIGVAWWTAQSPRRSVRHTMTKIDAAKQHGLPMVVVIIPCHREEASTLFRTIGSVLDSTYPNSRMHLFLGFDGFGNREMFNETAQVFGAVPLKGEDSCTVEATCQNTAICMSIFEHGGKGACQQKIFDLVKRRYTRYLQENSTFLLFLDSDTSIDKDTLTRLVDKLVSDSCVKPFEKVLRLDNSLRGPSGVFPQSHALLLAFLRRSPYCCYSRGSIGSTINC